MTKNKHKVQTIYHINILKPYAWTFILQCGFSKQFCINPFMTTGTWQTGQVQGCTRYFTINYNYITRSSWATMLTWVNSYKSLIQHFRLSVAMVTNQNEEFVQLLHGWWRNTQQTFIKKKFCQNICSEIAIKTYFHFSHYKSMETSSCHSNKSTYAMAIKNKLFVKANVMNISAKFQLHLPYGFRGDYFLIFFRKFILSVAMATNQVQRFGQNLYVW